MPLSLDTLAANPYRTLGLPAAASQSDIDTAARRLRIFNSPGEIPPTPFDLPALGPLPRAHMNIESAVATLADPAFRLQARLLWYHAAPPPAAFPDNPADPPADRLDNAIAALHAAMLHDPRALQSARWHDLLARFQSLSLDTGLALWLGTLENNGDFEKTASPDEVTDAVIHLPTDIIQLLVERALAAVANDDFLACRSILATLTAPDLHLADAAPDTITPILDRLEDTLDNRSSALDAFLREKLRTRHDNPPPFYAANLGFTTDAVKTYDTTLRPLKTLLEMSAQPDRIARARNRQAPLLALIGLGWEWSGRFITAQETYQSALEHAAGSPYETSILNDLRRIQPLAAKARAAIEAAEAARQRLAASLPTLHPKPPDPKPTPSPTPTPARTQTTSSSKTPPPPPPPPPLAKPAITTPARPRPLRDRFLMLLFLILAAAAILVAGITLVFLLLHAANPRAIPTTPPAPSPLPLSAPEDPATLLPSFTPTPLPTPTTQPPPPPNPLPETTREP